MMKHINFLVLIKVMINVSLFANTLKAQQMTTVDTALSVKDKSNIAISSLTAQGKLVKLKMELNAGLEAGLTANEIKEILVHTYAYCGFPRSIRGLQTFMEVMNERKERGIMDNLGVEASPIVSESSKYERGKKILEALTATPQPEKLSGYSAFAPTIDTFLKEHLFADIFERDVLTFAQRELVTISVIAAIGDADLALNVGWSPQQLNEFITVIHPTIGKKKSKAAKLVLKQVLQSHQTK